MDHLTDVDIYLRFFIAFAIIIALISIAAWLARFLGFNTSFNIRGKKEKRLAVVDSIPLDAKRRLVLVSRDEIEHLICIGGTTDFIIEQNVKTSIPLVDKNIVQDIDSSSQTKKAS